MKKKKPKAAVIIGDASHTILCLECYYIVVCNKYFQEILIIPIQPISIILITITSNIWLFVTANCAQNYAILSTCLIGRRGRIVSASSILENYGDLLLSR